MLAQNKGRNLMFLMLCILAYLSLFSKTAAAYFFSEEFNETSLDTSVWQIHQNAGSITPDGNTYTFSSNKNSFPYIYSKNSIFPENQDSEVTIKFQYISTAPWGNGIVVADDKLPANTQRPTAEHGTLGIWQDSISKLHVDSNICPESNPSCGTTGLAVYIDTTTNTQIHEFKFSYKNKKYYVFIDNNSIPVFVSAPTDRTPKYLWFGNPLQTDHNDLWTSFKIDYIRINTPGHPLLFLPGMMGCWDRGIVTGEEGENWRLWSIPYHTTYKPFLKNLQKAGLVENQDYFVFCYDWRKPIEHNKQKLSDFIQSNFSNEEKINLVGHSMGGLISRSYTQAYPNKVNKLITVGSPHSGTAKAYFAWEGGIVLDDNLLSRLGKELIVFLNNPFEQIPLRTIRSRIPSLKDLLPTYNFLVDKNNPGNIKPIASHNQKNDYFMNLNSNLQNEVKNKISTIYGTGLDTLEKIKVTSLQPHANWLHYALEMWEDGEPVSQIIKSKAKRDYSPSFINTNGDKTVTVLSANIQDVDSHQIHGNHGQIISSPSGVEKIFELLGLIFPQENISVSPIEKILALVLHSPANFWLTDQIPNSFFDPSAKTLIVLNPNDNLTLYVKGENNAKPQSLYEISFLELSNQGLLTTYRFEDKINPNQEKQFPLDSLKRHLFVNHDNHLSVFNSLLIKINKAKDLLNKWNSLNPYQKNRVKNSLNTSITQAQTYKKTYDKQKYQKAVFHLTSTRQHLFKARKLINKFGKDDALALGLNEQILSAFSEADYLYLEAQKKKGIHLPDGYLKLKLKITEKSLNRKNIKIQKLKDSGEKIYQYQGIAFVKAEQNYIKAQNALSEGKNLEAFLYSTLCLWFLYEV